MKRFLFLTFMFLVCWNSNFAQNHLKLWYDQPATYFEESLPLGNGKTGACVFGDPATEKIYLNDATLWSGEPVDPYMNPDAHQFIPAIRKALKKEDYRTADSLNRQVQGKFSQSFAPLGTLEMNFHHKQKPINYYRELDLTNAIAKVEYECDGIEFKREYFISHPDQIMMIKLTASKANSINVDLTFNSLLKYEVKNGQKLMKIDGYAPYHAEPNYRGDMPDAVQFSKDRGTRFSNYIYTDLSDGEVKNNNDICSITNATKVVLYVSIATSFNGFDKDPAKSGLDNSTIAKRQLEEAIKKGYQQIREDHLSDYQSLFNRLDLSLGTSSAPDLPTNDRLKRYTNGSEDRDLEVLYFQFGRYLLISSSRTPEVPANLQGIWNPYMRPPWSSNYTMNINVEENYWLAEIANLSELHRPFLGFIKNLATTGEVTAKTFYGVDKGWASCHNSDIWAMSNPVGDFGKGHPVWACWNMSGPWAVTHLWEHYLFTGDQDFLKEEAYPLMKGAAEFCLYWLVEDQNGYLITSPSTSPENLYITNEGYTGATLYGSTSDMAMIKECFMQCIKASEILNTDNNFRDSLSSALDQLYPYQIGGKGHLQEWYHDWKDSDPKHRHQSQLFGLYPGHHITTENTPELADACKVSLEIKGDETTGWSKGWRINLWARLKDGERSYKMYRELLRYVEPDGAENTQYSGGGGTYPNLFDAHPPFQIDGNFGGASGVIEMLIQSHNHQINLLPALPKAWSDGAIRGVCARGGFELSFKWSESELVELEVFSKNGNPCVLNYNGVSKVIVTEKGKHYTFDGMLKLL